jgi:hypothetical protein
VATSTLQTVPISRFLLTKQQGVLYDEGNKPSEKAPSVWFVPVDGSRFSHTSFLLPV